MSELGGGRASNGGARVGGPVPVPGAGSSSNIRTPTEIMRARNEREARRQEELKAEEQRRQEDRRRSAERRAAAVAESAPRFSQASSQYTPDVTAQQAPFEERRPGTGRVAGSDVLGDPTGRSTQDYSRRGPSVPQQDQPRPAPATAGASRRPQPSQSASRQPGSSAAAGPSQSQAPPRPQPAQNERVDDSGARSGASSFPHAFERWETLSSHWEGLTSYWLHKLEQNTEEIRDTIPNAATLNRQITDLSAAGANLFHAVVELQRLRASSERKFQRWFFDTRAENERNSETRAQLENQLRTERQAKETSSRQRGEAAIAAENARREHAEMQRELVIAKDEARRAWEELGRRNQESIDAAESLKSGRVTMVHGVSVVPYFGGVSRTGSLSQRPTTGDGQPYYGSAAGAAGLQSPGDEREYYRQDDSPTNTDPFMESSQLHHEPGKQQLSSAAYQPSSGMQGTPTTTSTSQTVISPSNRGQAAAGPSRLPVTAEEAERFYQHGGQATYLHGASASSQAAAPGPSVPINREDVISEGSYISEGDGEYNLGAHGAAGHDAEGRPIVFRHRVESMDTDDDYDTEADIRREQELAAQYGSGVLPEAPSVPATSAQAMADYPASATSGAEAQRPDYEGSGYENYLQSRPYGSTHYHPTRLSDVLEEEEERSSRRTGE